MMKVKETVPLLFVSDIEKSRAFYGQGLGFEITQSWEPDGALRWCRLEQGGAALMLQQADEGVSFPPEKGRGVTLYFICEDADIVYREITERGIEATIPTTAFYGMRQTEIRDPDGYSLCFENRVTP